MVTIKTVVVNVFLPSLSLRLAGIKALGYHRAKPAISPIEWLFHQAIVPIMRVWHESRQN